MHYHDQSILQPQVEHMLIMVNKLCGEDIMLLTSCKM